VKKVWKLPGTLVALTAIICGFVYFGTREPKFEFDSALGGRRLAGNPWMWDPMCRKLSVPRMPEAWYAFEYSPDVVYKAMAVELLPPEWERQSPGFFINRGSHLIVFSVETFDRRDRKEKVVVQIARGPNLVEQLKWKLFGAPPKETYDP
jgi:hypothetical protein